MSYSYPLKTISILYYNYYTDSTVYYNYSDITNVLWNEIDCVFLRQKDKHKIQFSYQGSSKEVCKMKISHLIQGT